MNSLILISLIALIVIAVLTVSIASEILERREHARQTAVINQLFDNALNRK